MLKNGELSFLTRFSQGPLPTDFSTALPLSLSLAAAIELNQKLALPTSSILLKLRGVQLTTTDVMTRPVLSSWDRTGSFYVGRDSGIEDVEDVEEEKKITLNS